MNHTLIQYFTYGKWMARILGKKGRKRSLLMWVNEWSRILPVFHTGVEVEEFCHMIACYNAKIYRQATKH
jgi:hypothetical protein